MISVLDQLYCSYANRTPFFSGGWGDSDMLQYLLNCDAKKIVRNRKLKPIQINWTNAAYSTLFRGTRLEGSFLSPYEFIYKSNRKKKVRYLPDFCKIANIEMWLPDKPTDRLVLHFAATGDEGYFRRRLVALPLLRHGIASVILENPYYGFRRDPELQSSHSPDVLTLMEMSRASIDEGIQIGRFYREKSFKHFIASGTSMGGYTSVAVASSVDFPMGAAALIPSHSAAPVYTEAALREACDWNKLDQENPLPNEHPVLVLRKLFDLSDLRHMPEPAPGSCSAVIGARADAYIPVYSCEIVHRLLPGSTLDWIRPGHVGAFFLGLGLLRRRIIEMFGKMEHF